MAAPASSPSPPPPMSTSPDLQIAVQGSSTGTVTLENAGTLSANSGAVVVGEYGTGTLDITNDGSLSSAAGFVGAGGDGGSGTVDINTGRWTVDDLLDIGVDEGSPGTVILNGEASTLEVGGDLTAGDAETGTLEVATGAFAYAGALIVAAQSTSGSDNSPQHG